jgi:hypothetical protein
MAARVSAGANAPRASRAALSWHSATWPACNDGSTVRILRSHRREAVGHPCFDAATTLRKISCRSRRSAEIAQRLTTLDPCDLDHALDFMG